MGSRVAEEPGPLLYHHLLQYCFPNGYLLCRCLPHQQNVLVSYLVQCPQTAMSLGVGQSKRWAPVESSHSPATEPIKEVSSAWLPPWL